MRIKNIWVKVAYLHFVLPVLFMRIKSIWVKVAYFGFCAFCALCPHEKHLSESHLFAFCAFCAFCAFEIFSLKKIKLSYWPYLYYYWFWIEVPCYNNVKSSILKIQVYEMFRILKQARTVIHFLSLLVVIEFSNLVL